ncbi:hypothetical protein C1646_752730 [Rhizophagus diaphanus]|nr:hypothetical protein C1646_752730 [Rhizophagus diaphanus] [Rhizophagus sp. MUCL 43196]
MKVHKKAENDLKEEEHWYNTKELNLSAFLNCHKVLVGQLDNKTEYERYNDALECSITTITSTAISLPTFGQQEGFAVSDFAAVVTAKARQFRLESIYELKCDTCIGSSYFHGLARICQNIQWLIIMNRNKTVCEDGLWIKHILSRKLKSNNTKLKLRDAISELPVNAEKSHTNAIPELPVNAEKSRTSKATFTPSCFAIVMEELIRYLNERRSLNQIILKLRDAIPKLPVNAEKSRTSKTTFTPHLRVNYLIKDITKIKT